MLGKVLGIGVHPGMLVQSVGKIPSGNMDGYVVWTWMLDEVVGAGDRPEMLVQIVDEVHSEVGAGM